jgi:hypothetical protein
MGEAQHGGGPTWGRPNIGEAQHGGGPTWGRPNMGEAQHGGGPTWGRPNMGARNGAWCLSDYQTDQQHARDRMARQSAAKPAMQNDTAPTLQRGGGERALCHKRYSDFLAVPSLNGVRRQQSS